MIEKDDYIRSLLLERSHLIRDNQALTQERNSYKREAEEYLIELTEIYECCEEQHQVMTLADDLIKALQEKNKEDGNKLLEQERSINWFEKRDKNATEAISKLMNEISELRTQISNQARTIGSYMNLYNRR